MFNGFNLSNIQDAKLGSTQITQIWYGPHLIWPTGPTPPHDYSQDYLTMTLLTNGKLALDKPGAASGTPNLYYSTDNGITWSNQFDSSRRTAEYPAGTKILMKNANILTLDISPSYPPYNINIMCEIDSTGDFNISGNVMSLIDGDNFRNMTSMSVNGTNYTFYSLFYASAATGRLMSAENLILPATTLTPYCYTSMFFGNSYMTSAPELPATILTESCYKTMFDSCAALTTAPDLLATTLVDSCYQGMFEGCSNLNYVKCLATDISAPYCLGSWLYQVSSSGTFVKDANTSWPTGSSGIPSNWTTVNN